MTLTADVVYEAFHDCLYKDEEPQDGHIKVEGIMSNFGLHPERLESHREEVKAWLMELPMNFHPANQGGGGGWTVLNMVMTKDDVQWAEHRNMEQLCVLAIGLGIGEFQLPREMWSMLPGSMPYFTIKEEAFE